MLSDQFKGLKTLIFLWEGTGEPRECPLTLSLTLSDLTLCTKTGKEKFIQTSSSVSHKHDDVFMSLHHGSHHWPNDNLKGKMQLGQ